MSTKIVQYVILTCDGPKCASNSGRKAPVCVAFTDEQVRSDPNAMPDEFFRFFKVQPNPNEEKIVEFCSRKCLTDYLVYEYVAPLSPREQAAQNANNEAVELKKKPPSRFNDPVVTVSHGAPPAGTGHPFNGKALSQADGHSEAA